MHLTNNNIMKLFKAYKIILLILLIVGCTSKKDVTELNGSVASAHPLATQAGQLILDNGGNAFDAAIAVAATLNVVEPMMSGIGGYGTILTYDATQKKIQFLNPSGRFPVKTNTDLMRPPTPEFMQNRVGPKSISTPGNLNAWKAMHEKFGKMEWDLLFESAIKYAEKGFQISRNTAYSIRSAFDDFSDYSRQFYSTDGQPLKKGEILIQEDLANTFKTIASEGVTPFYQGKIAKAIDGQMKKVESFLSIEDLRENKAEWWEPLKIKYRDYDVYTASLPANSFAAFVNLGLMQQIPQEELEYNTAEYLHLFAEMTKESYKARLAFSFDPEVKKAPIDSILSTEVLQSMVSKIDRNEATNFEAPFSPESKNTTHFVVIDKWGNIVSATQTLGNVFGSRVMVEGYGFWLNNSMAYSTFEPKGNPMDAFPGRHKLSGDCPIIIMKDNKPWAALGSPGGHTITQNVPQIIFNLIDFDMPMQKAIDAPKITFVEPNSIRVDRDLPQVVVNGLIEMGHYVAVGSIGNANGIKIIRNKEGEIISFDVGIDKRGEGRDPIMDR